MAGYGGCCIRLQNLTGCCQPQAIFDFPNAALQRWRSNHVLTVSDSDQHVAVSRKRGSVVDEQRQVHTITSFWMLPCWGKPARRMPSHSEPARSEIICAEFSQPIWALCTISSMLASLPNPA